MPIPTALKLLLEKYGLTKNLNIDPDLGGGIDHTNFNTLSLSPEVKEVTAKLFEAGFGLGRADLASIQSSMTSPIKKHKKIIGKLKPYLRPPDHAALIASATIVKLEDEGKDTTKLRELLNSCYGSRGRKIYNMLRSDINRGKNIFLGIILPFLIQAKASYPGDEIRVTGLFTLFFEDILKYFPNAIWIYERFTKKAIQEITQRFEKSPAMEVFVFARGKDFMRVAEKICDEIDCEVSRYEYTLGNEKACRYTLRRKPH